MKKGKSIRKSFLVMIWYEIVFRLYGYLDLKKL